MCKHPVAHVSSPSLLSFLILNQRRLILHCHVCSCPLERPLVVICTWLWLLQKLENGCVFFPGKCRGLWQEAETQFICHYCNGSHTLTSHSHSGHRSRQFTSLMTPQWEKNLHIPSDMATIRLLMWVILTYILTWLWPSKNQITLVSIWKFPKTLTSRNVGSRFSLHIMKPNGGLTGECVFIDRRVLTVLLGRSALTQQSCI